MKKAIFTLSFVALFSLASNAQDRKAKDQNTKEQSKVESVNPDGTTTQVNSAGQPIESTSAKKEETAPKSETPVKKKGTRMAINEKGLPGNTAPKKDTKTAADPNTSKKQ